MSTPRRRSVVVRGGGSVAAGVGEGLATGDVTGVVEGCARVELG
jgi:hypothetical protein